MIKLAKLDNIFWTNGSFEKPNTVPDISTFTIKEDILVDWNKAKTIGVVILEGEWNYAHCEGSWYFLERVKVADRENAWYYALVKDWWSNWIDIGVIVEGFCTKTNDIQLLLDNVNYTEPLVTEPCRQYRINLTESFSRNWWDNLQVLRLPLKQPTDFVDYVLGSEDIYRFIKDCINAPKIITPIPKDAGVTIIGVLKPAITLSLWKTTIYEKLLEILEHKEDYILSKIGDGTQAGLGIQAKIKDHYVLTPKYASLGVFEEQGRVLQLDFYSLIDIVEVSSIQHDSRTEWEAALKELDWKFETLDKQFKVTVPEEHGQELYKLYPKVYLPYEDKDLAKNDSLEYHLFSEEGEIEKLSVPYRGELPQCIFDSDNRFHILVYANRLKTLLNFSEGRISLSEHASNIPFYNEISPPEFGFLLFQEIRQRKKWNWVHFLGNISSHFEVLIGLKRDWNIPTFDSYDRDVIKWINRIKEWWSDVQLFNSLYPYSWLYYFTVLKDNKLTLQSKDWAKWTGISGWFNLKPNQEGELNFTNNSWRALISRDVDKNYLDATYFDKVRKAFFDSKAITESYYRPIPLTKGDIFFSELEAFWYTTSKSAGYKTDHTYYLENRPKLNDLELPFLDDEKLESPIIFYYNNHSSKFHLGIYYKYQLHHSLSSSPENTVNTILNVNGVLDEANIVNKSTEKTITYHHISQLTRTTQKESKVIPDLKLDKVIAYFASEEGKEVWLMLNKFIEYADYFKKFYTAEDREKVGLKNLSHLDKIREGEFEWLLSILKTLNEESLKSYDTFPWRNFMKESAWAHGINTFGVSILKGIVGATTGSFLDDIREIQKPPGRPPSFDWSKKINIWRQKILRPALTYQRFIKPPTHPLTIGLGLATTFFAVLKGWYDWEDDTKRAYELGKLTDVLILGNRYLIGPKNLEVIEGIYGLLLSIQEAVVIYDDLNLKRNYEFTSPEALKDTLNNESLKRDIHLALGINPRKKEKSISIQNKLFDLVGTSYYLYVDTNLNGHLVFKQQSVKSSIEFKERKSFTIPECELVEQDYVDILNQQTLLQVSTTSYPLQERLVFNKENNFNIEINKFSFDEKNNLYDYFIVNYQGARQLVDVKLAIPKRTAKQTRVDNVFSRAQLAFEQERWREEFKYRKEIFDYQKKREFEGFQFQRERLTNRTGEAAFNLAFGLISSPWGTVGNVANLLGNEAIAAFNQGTLEQGLTMAVPGKSHNVLQQQRIMLPYKRTIDASRIAGGALSPISNLVASGMQLRELALQGRELDADVREATGVFVAQQNQFKTEHIFNERNFAMQLMNIGNVYHQGEVNDRDLVDEYNKERELNEVHLIYRVPSQMQKEALERYYEQYGANCQIPSVRFEFRRGLKVGAIYAFGYIDKIINLWPTEDREALKAILQNGFKICSFKKEEKVPPVVVIPWTSKIDELLKVATPEQKNVLFKKLTTQLDRLGLIKELVKQEPNTDAIIPIIEEKVDKHILVSKMFREESPIQLTNLVIKNLVNVDKEKIFGLLLSEKDKGKLVEKWIDNGVDLTRVLWDKYPEEVIAKNIYDSKVREFESLLAQKKAELEQLDIENRNNKAISAKTLKSLQEKIRALNNALEKTRALTVEKGQLESNLSRVQGDLTACSRTREQLQLKVPQLTKELENVKKEKDILGAEKVNYEKELNQLKINKQEIESDLQQKIKDLESKNKEIAAYTAKLASFVKALEGVKGIVGVTEDKLPEAVEQLKQTHKETVQDLQNKLTEREQELKRLKETQEQELAKVKQELEEANKTIAGLRAIEHPTPQDYKFTLPDLNKALPFFNYDKTKSYLGFNSDKWSFYIVAKYSTNNYVVLGWSKVKQALVAVFTDTGITTWGYNKHVYYYRGYSLWFINAQDIREDPKKGYYIFKDYQGSFTMANNWQDIQNHILNYGSQGQATNMNNLPVNIISDLEWPWFVASFIEDLSDQTAPQNDKIIYFNNKTKQFTLDQYESMTKRNVQVSNYATYKLCLRAIYTNLTLPS